MKYLYVLSSDESDNYLEQALLSITSLRMHTPNACIVLLTDNLTAMNLTGIRAGILNQVDEVKSVSIETRFNKKARSRWLKTSMRLLIEGDFLYIDSDTIIAADLSAIEGTDIEIGAVLEDHTYLSEYEKTRPSRLKFIKKMFAVRNFNYGFDFKIYFNGGVFFCKDCKTGFDFFNEWHRLWLQCFELNLLNDQASLNQANFNMGNPIRELDGIWNCQLIHDGALRFVHKAKILHYFTTNVHEKFFLLGNKKYTDKIKATGIVDQEMLDMLTDIKSQFAPNTRIMLIDPTFNDYYDSAICGAAKRIYHSRIGSLIEVVLAKIKRHIFTPLRKKIFLRK